MDLPLGGVHEAEGEGVGVVEAARAEAAVGLLLGDHRGVPVEGDGGHGTVHLVEPAAFGDPAFYGAVVEQAVLLQVGGAEGVSALALVVESGGGGEGYAQLVQGGAEVRFGGGAPAVMSVLHPVVAVVVGAVVVIHNDAEGAVVGVVGGVVVIDDVKPIAADIHPPALGEVQGELVAGRFGEGLRPVHPGGAGFIGQGAVQHPPRPAGIGGGCGDGAVRQIAVGLELVDQEDARQHGGGQGGQDGVKARRLPLPAGEAEGGEAQAEAQRGPQGVAEQIVHVGLPPSGEILDDLDGEGGGQPRRQRPVPPLEPGKSQGQKHAERYKHGDIQQRVEPDLQGKGVPRLPEGQEQVGLHPEAHSRIGGADQQGDGGQPRQIAGQQGDGGGPPDGDGAAPVLPPHVVQEQRPARQQGGQQRGGQGLGKVPQDGVDEVVHEGFPLLCICPLIVPDGGGKCVAGFSRKPCDFLTIWGGPPGRW